MSVGEILGATLRRRDDLGGDEWCLWERRTWNVHRGAMHWRPRQDPASWAEVERAVREKVRAAYRP